MVNFVEGFAKVHYNKIGLFAVFQVIKNLLSEADKLDFTAAFRSETKLEWAEEIV